MINDNNPDWLYGVIKFLRGMGFFANEADLPGEQLAKYIEKKYCEEFKTASLTFHENVEVEIAALDKERTWWNALTWVDDLPDIRNSNYYTQCLTEWSKISRGDIIMTDIKEEWQSDVVTITLNINGKKEEITIENLFDVIFDTGIIHKLNKKIGKYGCEFLHFLNPDIIIEHFIDIGTVALDKKEFEKALEVFDMTIRKFPEDHRGYYNSGRTLDKLNRREEAARLFRETINICLASIKKKGDNKKDLEIIGRCYKKTGNHNEANRYLNKAKKY